MLISACCLVVGLGVRIRARIRFSVWFRHIGISYSDDRPGSQLSCVVFVQCCAFKVPLVPLAPRNNRDNVTFDQ